MTEETSLEFSEDWFNNNIPMWRAIIRETKPRRILEIGSYEGRSTCFMILECSIYNSLDMFCIDSWQGGVEHAGTDFNEIESRFDRNIAAAISQAKNPVSIHKRKGLSSVELSRMVVNHEGEFDLIYVDGSHEASDVFLDVAMAFKLCAVGGILIFDDYKAIHKEEQRFDYPALAINSFLDTHANKLVPLHFAVTDKNLVDSKYVDANGAIDPHILYQVYLKKIKN